MELSLVQASKEAGKSKSTIHRAIKTGRLSAQRHEDGSYSINPAELFRVFPRTSEEPIDAEPEKPSGTPSASDDVLRVMVRMLEAQLEREQETVSDLRRRLDRAEDRIQTLSHQTEKLDQKGGQVHAKRGFWGFLDKR